MAGYKSGQYLQNPAYAMIHHKLAELHREWEAQENQKSTHPTSHGYSFRRGCLGDLASVGGGCLSAIVGLPILIATYMAINAGMKFATGLFLVLWPAFLIGYGIYRLGKRNKH